MLGDLACLPDELSCVQAAVALACACVQSSKLRKNVIAMHAQLFKCAAP